MVDDAHKILKMSYSGRIIDQLGIQMYQSPVAAIAELIANSWDADSEAVLIALPDDIGDEGAEIYFEDDGFGMTFEECEKRYLNVGYCRRGNNPMERSPEKNRPILGRKGIGKLAGFGIAEKILIETVSKESREKTVFEMDLNSLRGVKYVQENQDIAVIEYKADCDEPHGTKIYLRDLTLQRNISDVSFRKSMARRFLLHRRAADFHVLVNGENLPESEGEVDLEFVFPRDYRDDEKPDGLVIDGEWGKEILDDNLEIRWRICFYKKPINEEELRGISIFSHGKLAQTPFSFNLSGGLGGQHGQEYISGQVEADYLDEQTKDYIAPERQRVDFKTEESIPLLEWGQGRIKSLLQVWKSRRGEEKIKILEDKISPFSSRLGKLPASERKTITRAITNLAKIPALEQDEFIELGNSILTSWEGGRLKELISEISENTSMTGDDLLHAFMETGVLTALNIAEAIKTKIEAIVGLQKHIEKRMLENPLRDYIAQNPWLIAAKWDTFKIERSVEGILKDCAVDVKFDDAIYKGRVDLALSSNDQLLVIEFMRPGLKLDFDHLNRFDTYVHQIREKVTVQTQLGFKKVIGYLVADGLEQRAGLRGKIEAMEDQDMIASDWDILLRKSVDEYREYMQILSDRDPSDDRLKALLK